MVSKALYWLLTLGSVALVVHSAPLPVEEGALNTQVSRDGGLWKDTVHMTIESRNTEVEASTEGSQVGALWKDAVHVTIESRDGELWHDAVHQTLS